MVAAVLAEEEWGFLQSFQNNTSHQFENEPTAHP
jgi:hypothetical protein